MRTVRTVIVGAGQAGLAMSRELTCKGVDHLVLERGTIANAWRADRWDSLRLLTPNWANYLPGEPYPTDDPDGYMSVGELVSRFTSYADQIAAPIQLATRVERVRRCETGYHLETSQGPIRCKCLVVATGACAHPIVPPLAQEIPKQVVQVTPLSYKRPDGLPDGGVLIVGASATGVQLAREIQRSGRQVTLAVGGHTRLPRNYRNYDIEWWLHATGLMDERANAIEDLERARRLPSPQLIGGSDPVDLNALQDLGVTIVGRLSTIRNGDALFSGGLAHVCASADLKMNRFLDLVDSWIDDWSLATGLPSANRPEPTRIAKSPSLKQSLTDGSIRTLVWATGYRPDFSWLSLPVFDRRGRLQHSGGVIDAPGLYVLGLPILRRRQSHQISGVGYDAAELALHLRSYLDGGGRLAA